METIVWGSALLALLVGGALPAQAVTLDENHALDPNAHHGKVHAATHSKGGEDQVSLEDLRTRCVAGEVVKSDGSNGLICGADSGEASASYVTMQPEAALSGESVLGTQVIMQDLFSGRPAAGSNGRLFFASDTKVVYRDTGSTWTPITGVSDFTLGSVPYTGIGGVLTEDNDHFLWSATAQRLVMSTEPTTNEDVFLRYQVYGTNETASKGLLLQGARGTKSSPTIIGSLDSVGLLLAQGHDGNSYSNVAAINFIVGAAPGDADMPGNIAFATSGDGSTVLTERMRILHDGTIRFPAPTVLVLANESTYRAFNAAGTASLGLIGLTATNRVSLADDGSDIQIGRAPIAVGTGSVLTTTRLVIGCSGCPVTATQSGWFKFFDSSGVAAYVPIWR